MINPILLPLGWAVRQSKDQAASAMG